MGAEVIKVERPAAATIRAPGARRSRAASRRISSRLNRNKRSLCVDLSAEEGRAVVQGWHAGCQVFLHSMKPGSAEARGLGYDDLAEVESPPRLLRDERLRRAGPAEGPAGLRPRDAGLQRADEPVRPASGRRAPRVPVSIVDVGTGMWAAIGILGACLARERSGRGTRVQVSLLETSLSWMNALITAHAITGKAPARIGTSLANAAPYELFRARDGHVLLAAPNDRFFAPRAGPCNWRRCPRTSASPPTRCVSSTAPNCTP